MNDSIWSFRHILKIIVGGISLGLIGFQIREYSNYQYSKDSILDDKSIVVKDVPLEMPDSRLINLGADIPKRNAIVSAFKHAWHAYERDAWGYDEYHPISKRGSNLSKNGAIGFNIIDSLDTIQLMGLEDEYKRCRNWISNLTFDVDDKFNTFETTIRVLGGLLSSYYLSSNPFSESPGDFDEMYLDLASDLGERLLSSFSIVSGLPLTYVNLSGREGIPDDDNRGFVSTAEAASLQLEFKYLSHLTEDPIFWTKAEKVMEIIKDAPKRDGLVPIFIDPRVKQFYFSAIRLGSRGDSYYEYLLKQYLQTNRTEEVYREMYDEARRGIKKHLIKITQGPKKLIHTVEMAPRKHTKVPGYRMYSKQDHLACFIAGLFMLGVTEGLGDVPPNQDTFNLQQHEDWWVGAEILKTCYDTYNSTKTGLSPEIIHFHSPEKELAKHEDWYIKHSSGTDEPLIDSRYILRPETLESLFIAFRLSGDQKYRDQGWEIFKSIERYAKLDSGGYTSIKDVNRVPVEREDKMETFLLSETFKYLFLLFEDSSVAPLDKVVFNTEAHILPIFNPSFPTNI